MLSLQLQMLQRSICSSFDLLCNALSITHKDLDHPFTLPAPEKEIIKFINQLRCPKKFRTISTLRVNDMYQPWRTNLTMINKCLTGKAIAYDLLRLPMLQFLLFLPLSFKYVIKLDLTLGNLKFANKGTKDPIFGMAIPVVMLNDDIKASHEYSEVDDDEVDLEETEGDEEEPLVRTRPSRVTIGGEAHRESEEIGADHSKKGSCEGFGVTLKVPNELVFKSSNEGAGVSPEVPNEPSDYSSTSSSDSEFIAKDILSNETEVTEKTDNEKTANVVKYTEEQMNDEQVAEKHAGNEEVGADQGDNEPAGDEQADVQMTEALLEKPEATLISSSQTLSSIKFTNQFLNESVEVNLTDVLKDLVEPEVQSMVDISVTQEKPDELSPPLVDTTVTLIPNTTTISLTQPPQTQPKRRKTKVILKKSKQHESQVESRELESRVTRLEKKVHAMSSFNLPEAIDKSVKAHLKNVLPKDVPDFGKIKMEKDSKKSIPKECEAYNRHPANQALYDALLVSLSINEDDMDKQLSNLPIQKKRRRDDQDQDPPTYANKDSKKKKRKDFEEPSSKKTKDQLSTTLSKPSKTNKYMQAEETVEELDQEEAMDDEGPAVDEVVNTKEHPQDDAGLRQDRSKQPPRPETPDLE
ncbi:hypothetical protein Tco_0615469 [Tanacetum coccineum]